MPPTASYHGYPVTQCWSGSGEHQGTPWPHKDRDDHAIQQAVQPEGPERLLSSNGKNNVRPQHDHVRPIHQELVLDRLPDKNLDLMANKSETKDKLTA